MPLIRLFVLHNHSLSSTPSLLCDQHNIPIILPSSVYQFLHLTSIHLLLFPYSSHPPLFPNLLPSLHLPACVTAASTLRRTRPTAQHPSFWANNTAFHAGQWPLLQPTMPTPEPQSGPTGRGRGGKESKGGRQRGGLQACMPSLDCSLDHGCLWGNWTPAYAYALHSMWAHRLHIHIYMHRQKAEERLKKKKKRSSLPIQHIICTYRRWHS